MLSKKLADDEAKPFMKLREMTKLEKLRDTVAKSKEEAVKARDEAIKAGLGAKKLEKKTDETA